MPTENPEYVLTSKQMENFVRNMSRANAGQMINNRSSIENVNNTNNNDDNIIFQNCTFPLNNVTEPKDFTATLKQIAKQNRR